MKPKEKWDSIEQYLEYLRHLAAYAFVEKLVAKKAVLEVGCGTGYGTYHLSKFASEIVAVDIAKENISICEAEYKKENLIFLSADGLKLPFEDRTFEVVVSFQVIEHIEPTNVQKYLLEIKRVLGKGGIFVVSTPNSKMTLLPFQKPWYSEHKKEYDCKSFKKSIKKVFEDFKIYSLRGSETMEYIERNRVRQNPFLVYIVAPLSPLVRKLLPSSSLSRLSNARNSLKFRKNYPLIPNESFVDRFSVDDFKVDENCAKRSLDIFGICVKV